ncbi:sigma 54-interacting transcriptional regulator [Hymenobacter terrenus]|uniref:sigma 54-interacting transcriptional regulator n=1 Tax=Hymenobacter terrenus TaxID=1629124 RepID=UPI0006968CFA|nr:sigma 54-interacting transcriptional regulator [Hymenobacter terrenus]
MKQHLDVLLSISQAVATIHNRDELMSVMTTLLKPLFGFDDAVVMVIDVAAQQFRTLYASAPADRTRHTAIPALYDNQPLPGSLVEWIIAQAAPFRMDTGEIVARFPELPGTRLMRDVGIQDSLMGALRCGGQVIGSLGLHSETPGHFSAYQQELFQDVADLLAVAVGNVLANEEILALKQQLELEKTYLVEEIKTTHNFTDIIGTSAVLQAAFHQVEQVAPTDSTVLLEGETGTGKELFARAVHDQSPRRGRVLIKVNCAALPPQLIESELFGHERGAFTGAHERRIGKFELAAGSTIFLDEIGELPLELQAKLLRVLQEREIERLGGRQPIPVDVRVVAATNRRLSTEVAAGRFRADLYYRLSVFPIYLPALRERTDDIPLLANYFLEKYSRRMKKPGLGIKAGAMLELLRYEWPGNVRELENVIEQAVILTRDAHLSWGRPLGRALPRAEPPAPARPAANGAFQPAAALKQAAGVVEKENILAALRQANGRIRGTHGAAALLHMPPTTLESKMKRLGIARKF